MDEIIQDLIGVVDVKEETLPPYFDNAIGNAFNEIGSELNIDFLIDKNDEITELTNQIIEAFKEQDYPYSYEALEDSVEPDNIVLRATKVVNTIKYLMHKNFDLNTNQIPDLMWLKLFKYTYGNKSILKDYLIYYLNEMVMYIAHVNGLPLEKCINKFTHNRIDFMRCNTYFEEYLENFERDLLRKIPKDASNTANINDIFYDREYKVYNTFRFFKDDNINIAISMDEDKNIIIDDINEVIPPEEQTKYLSIYNRRYVLAALILTFFKCLATKKVVLTNLDLSIALKGNIEDNTFEELISLELPLWDIIIKRLKPNFETVIYINLFINENINLDSFKINEDEYKETKNEEEE